MSVVPCSRVDWACMQVEEGQSGAEQAGPRATQGTPGLPPAGSTHTESVLTATGTALAMQRVNN